MIKFVFIILVTMLLSACDAMKSPTPNQCLRQELFEKCMVILPKGPDATKYNDWAEVVTACSQQSYYSSLRPETQIPIQCKVAE